uniref:Ig-like domain-containing protein n=1 Tax=Erpetoichthys calabaricus TaxID=27687 RepID=A0A8C4X6P1_ERPCA
MLQRIILIFLASLGYGSSDRVWQPESSVQVLQKQQTEIICTFETTDTDPYLFWYIQPLSGSPRHLMTITSTYSTNAEGFKERFDATLNRINKTAHLTISSSKLSDSAIYFCALRPTVRKIKLRALQKLLSKKTALEISLNVHILPYNEKFRTFYVQN